MNAICLVIDRLHAGYLGCYGNSWISTRNFDRLAADGFLFDQALIESPDLAVQYASMTSGCHVVRRAKQHPAEPLLIERLNNANINTALITDDPDVARMPWAATIDEVLQVDVQQLAAPADEIHETNLARLFAVAGQWLEAADEPFCLWLHCGSLGHSWDVPLEFRNAYRDEDDPPPLSDVAVPCRWLPENYDPDERLAIAHAYAGQVAARHLPGRISRSVQSRSCQRSNFAIRALPARIPLRRASPHRTARQRIACRAGPCAVGYTAA